MACRWIEWCTVVSLRTIAVSTCQDSVGVSEVTTTTVGEDVVDSNYWIRPTVGTQWSRQIWICIHADVVVSQHVLREPLPSTAEQSSRCPTPESHRRSHPLAADPSQHHRLTSSPTILLRPCKTTGEELIRVAGTRYAIEECCQTAKNEVGPRLPSAPLRRPAPAHYPGHVGSRLPHCHRKTVEKGGTSTQTGSPLSASPRFDVSWHT
jgi:hypothetical protein